MHIIVKLMSRLTWRFSVNTRHLQRKCAQHFLFYSSRYWRFLLAFIFMISRQMLDLEQNEIALLKSRGSSKKQIILIYFLQSVILSAMSAVVGLPLGYFLCKALGSTNGFFGIYSKKSITYHAWHFGIFCICLVRCLYPLLSWCYQSSATPMLRLLM